MLEMHIYETASWWITAFANWHEDHYQQQFFALIEKYHDRILFEVTGHDHLAGLRTHKVTESGSDAQYLNKVLFPSITANSDTNPGFGTFEYDTETQVVSKLQFTYVDVDGTIGMPAETPFEELPWMNVDFETKFGLMDLSGESIRSLTDRLMGDPEKAREFEFNRMGVDTSNERQVHDGLKAFKSTGLIGKTRTAKNAFLRAEDFAITACVMTESMYVQELTDCAERA